MNAVLVVRDIHQNGTSERAGYGGSSWQALHQRVLSFARRRAGFEWEEGRLLREAQRAGVHRRLGMGSFAEYVERHFGYNGRLLKEKLRVAQALEQLPETSDALRSGDLTWSAVRELTRVATPATERAWLEGTREFTVRQVEDAVSGRKPGDLPGDPADPMLRRHVLHFEVTGETHALWMDALAKLKRDSGGPLDDDAALLLMASTALAATTGKSDEGRASYQVQMNICKRCRHAEQVGNGQAHAVASPVAEMSLCDAQLLGDSADPHVGRATQTIPPAVRRHVMRRDNGRCVVSGCKHAMFVDVHHIVPRSEDGQHEPDNLACLCTAHHRAVHDGRLVIEGRPSTGLMFRHADGTRYGGDVCAEMAERNAQVFAALLTQGFRERQSRAALERCAKTMPPNATRGELLRAAILWLTSS